MKRNASPHCAPLEIGSWYGCPRSAPQRLCGGSLNPDPRGPAALEIANLGWLMFGLATVIFVVVMGLLLYALFHRRHEAAVDGMPSPGRDSNFVVWGGIIVPIIVLIGLYILTLQTLAALAAPTASDQLVIEIVGQQWWWELHYPDQAVTTANEIHIPAGFNVLLDRLSSLVSTYSMNPPAETRTS